MNINKDIEAKLQAIRESIKTRLERIDRQIAMMEALAGIDKQIKELQVHITKEEQDEDGEGVIDC